MTLVILRIKLALIRNSLRGTDGKVGGAGIAYGAAILCGLAAGGLLLWSRTAGPAAHSPVILGVCSTLFVGWFAAPLFATGLDGTVGPERLAVFPLTTRQLTSGLFVAAAVGGGGVFSLLTLIGVVGATAPVNALFLISTAAALALVGVCVAAARMTAAVISAADGRVRDVLIFVGPLLLMALSFAPVLLQFRSETSGSLDLRGLRSMGERVALLLPSGPAARSMLAASAGDVGPALAWLVPAIAWVGLFFVLWSLALARSQTRAVSSPSGRADKDRAISGALFPRLVRWLPRSRMGAVAAKELRLIVRDPRQRIALLGALMGAVGFTLSGLTDLGPGTVLRVSAVAFFLGATATNLYGFDGSSHWINVAAGDDARADLAGKCVARAVITAPVVAVLAAVVANLAGDWSRVLPAFALSCAAFGVGLGAAVWVSVVHPWPMPPGQKNLFAGAKTGQSFQAIGPSLLITFVGAIVLFGLGLPMASASAGAARLFGLSAAAVVIGAAAFAAGLSRAVVLSKDRQPELLLALTKG